MALAKDTTYYMGHLFEIKGVIAERRAKRQRKEGQNESAKDAENEAIEAFERSMKIQVIEKLLDAGEDVAPE